MTSRTIFIAYAHKDWRWEEKVAIHLGTLKQAGYDIDVWSDQRIGGGQHWLQEIEKAVAQAQVAILMISANFLTSDFITSKEIPDLLQRRDKDGLPVIPVLVRHCAWESVPWLKVMNIRPSGARPLADVNPDKALRDITNEVAQLLEGTAAEKTDRKSAAQKVTPMVSTQPALGNDITPLATLPVGGLALPCFFPSVSSAAKSNLTPLDHMKVLVNLQHPCFLASVYDFARASRDDRLVMGTLIDRATQNGQVILLDSGMYERKWLRDNNWSRRSFHASLSSIRCHLGFFFDQIKAQSTPRKTAIAIATRVRNDRREADLEALFPIVHTSKSADLPELCTEVTNDLDSDIVAVAEREIGEGLLAGAKTMIAIRRALDATGRYRVIHLLGAGNPLSILVYAACGADSFDGLDWCQTVVDYDGKRLYHNQQLDFFAEQSDFARADDLGYSTRMLAHNLTFYRQWMAEIQAGKKNADTLESLLRQVLPSQFCDELLKLLDGKAPMNMP